MSAPEFDPYSNDYKSLVNESLAFSGLDVDYFTRVKAEYLKDILLKTFGKTDVDVLDLGCGIGNYHTLLRPALRSLAGIDVSSESIKIAGTRNVDTTYKVFDGADIPFPEKTFDVVFAVCVFHHVPVAARATLIEDARRVLRDGGIFVIFEHNPINPLTMRVVNRCVFDKDAVLLKSPEAEGLLANGGFKDVRSRFILTVPSFNRVTRMLDQSFGRLPLGAQYFSMGRL
jgi:SAM-dependent methyltransferase